MLYAWFWHCLWVETWMEASLSKSTSVTSLTAFQAKSLPGNLKQTWQGQDHFEHNEDGLIMHVLHR